MGTGVLDHVMTGLLIFIPFGPVTPVLARHLPAFERLLLAAFKAFQLFVRRNVQPKLNQNRATFNELVLKVIDLGKRSTPLIFRCESLDSFDQHPTVPTAVEDRQMTPMLQTPPESPQVMSRVLLISRLAVLQHTIIARV